MSGWEIDVLGGDGPNGGIVLTKMVREVYSGGRLLVMVLDIVLRLFPLVYSNVDAVGHGNCVELDMVSPCTAGSHLGNVVVECRPIVEEVEALVLVPAEVKEVTSPLSKFHVEFFRAVELVCNGTEAAITVAFHVSNTETEGAEGFGKGFYANLC